MQTKDGKTDLSNVNDSITAPDFSKEDYRVLKKYFEFSQRVREQLNKDLLAALEDHPLWGPMTKSMSAEQKDAQNKRSVNLQKVAIYEGKWKGYIDDLIAQGRAYARMNISYNEWYDIITLAKVLMVPYIKKEFSNSPSEAVDVMVGLSKLTDYAMYGIAESYFKEKNEIIRTSTERFKLIFEASKDIILHVGVSGEIMAINHSPRFKKEELIGKNIFETLEGENAEKMKAGFNAAIEDKTPAYFETQTDLPEGKTYYSSSVSPIVGENGQVTSAVMISRDITPLKNAETALRLVNTHLESEVAKRTEELSSINRELESFTYSVSHDLRSPLRAINGFSEILKEECPNDLNDEAKDALEEIVNNVKKMGLLIDNLLEFSRLGKQPVTKATVDMKELTTSLISELKKIEGKNTAFVMGELSAVHGDLSMLKQVMINLLSNAVKYSSKKEHPKVEIGSRKENGEVIVFVKDNGAGFNMKYYDKLFGVFQRLHSFNDFEGTGVGLAIVQRIITRHAGKVGAEGVENEGATFYFSLPNQ